MTNADGDLSRFREIAVVLGGGLLPDGSPAEYTRVRAEAGAELARARDLAVIVAGSHGHGRTPKSTEASLMAEQLIARGVAPERIFLEDQSRDTLSNAAFVAERYLAGIAPRPLFIITSPFHMARSLATFGLVLGPAWRLEPYPAARGAHEDAHAATEELYLGHTRARLLGLQPGDIGGIAKRVRASLPELFSDDPGAG